MGLPGPIGALGPIGPMGQTGPTGPRGPTGASVVLINNTVFVDAQFGQDAFGALEDMQSPFQTIGAARAAAPPGFVVFVQPGEYKQESGLSLDDGVSFYFSEGATIENDSAMNGPMFVVSNDGSALKGSVQGMGVFETFGAATEPVLDVPAGVVGQISLEAQAILYSAAASRGVVSFASSSSVLIELDVENVAVTFLDVPFVLLQDGSAGSMSVKVQDVKLNGPFLRSSPSSSSSTSFQCSVTSLELLSSSANDDEAVFDVQDLQNLQGSALEIDANIQSLVLRSLGPIVRASSSSSSSTDALRINLACQSIEVDHAVAEIEGNVTFNLEAQTIEAETNTDQALALFSSSGASQVAVTYDELVVSFEPPTTSPRIASAVFDVLDRSQLTVQGKSTRIPRGWSDDLVLRISGETTSTDPDAEPSRCFLRSEDLYTVTRLVEDAHAADPPARDLGTVVLLSGARHVVENTSPSLPVLSVLANSDVTVNTSIITEISYGGSNSAIFIGNSGSSGGASCALKMDLAHLKISTSTSSNPSIFLNAGTFEATAQEIEIENLLDSNGAVGLQIGLFPNDPVKCQLETHSLTGRGLLSLFVTSPSSSGALTAQSVGLGTSQNGGYVLGFHGGPWSVQLGSVTDQQESSAGAPAAAVAVLSTGSVQGDLANLTVSNSIDGLLASPDSEHVELHVGSVTKTNGGGAAVRAAGPDFNAFIAAIRVLTDANALVVSQDQKVQIEVLKVEILQVTLLSSLSSSSFAPLASDQTLQEIQEIQDEDEGKVEEMLGAGMPGASAVLVQTGAVLTGFFGLIDCTSGNHRCLELEAGSKAKVVADKMVATFQSAIVLGDSSELEATVGDIEVDNNTDDEAVVSGGQCNLSVNNLNCTRSGGAIRVTGPNGQIYIKAHRIRTDSQPNFEGTQAGGYVLHIEPGNLQENYLECGEIQGSFVLAPQEQTLPIVLLEGAGDTWIRGQKFRAAPLPNFPVDVLKLSGPGRIFFNAQTVLADWCTTAFSLECTTDPPSPMPSSLRIGTFETGAVSGPACFLFVRGKYRVSGNAFVDDDFVHDHALFEVRPDVVDVTIDVATLTSGSAILNGRGGIAAISVWANTIEGNRSKTTTGLPMLAHYDAGSLRVEAQSILDRSTFFDLDAPVPSFLFGYTSVEGGLFPGNVSVQVANFERKTGGPLLKFDNTGSFAVMGGNLTCERVALLQASAGNISVTASEMKLTENAVDPVPGIGFLLDTSPLDVVQPLVLNFSVSANLVECTGRVFAARGTPYTGSGPRRSTIFATYGVLDTIGKTLDDLETGMFEMTGGANGPSGGLAIEGGNFEMAFGSGFDSPMFLVNSPMTFLMDANNIGRAANAGIECPVFDFRPGATAESAGYAYSVTAVNVTNGGLILSIASGADSTPQVQYLVECTRSLSFAFPIVRIKDTMSSGSPIHTFGGYMKTDNYLTVIENLAANVTRMRLRGATLISSSSVGDTPISSVSTLTITSQGSIGNGALVPAPIPLGGYVEDTAIF